MKEAIQGRMSRGLVFIQALLGIGAYAALALPYLRRTHGLNRLQPGQRYLFVANHVSLLVTILLGGVCWRHGMYPQLTIGDKKNWNASPAHRLLRDNIA